MSAHILDNPVMLRDLLKKAILKSGLSIDESAEMMVLNPMTIRSFCNRQIDSPNEETRSKMEKFIYDAGITRETVRQAMVKRGRGHQSGSAEKKIPALEQALAFVRSLLENKKYTQKQLAILMDIPRGTMGSLPGLHANRLTKNGKKIIDFYEKRSALSDPPLNTLLGGSTSTDKAQLAHMGIIASEKPKSPMDMSSHRPGRHYLCAFLDDWESASVMASIMNNHSIPEAQKKTLLGKLFAKEFPTLAQ